MTAEVLEFTSHPDLAAKIRGKPGVDVRAVLDRVACLAAGSFTIEDVREARATVERLAAAAEAFVAMYADEPNEEDSFVNPVAFEMRAALAAFRGEQS